MTLFRWSAQLQPLSVELVDHTGWIQLWRPFITAMVGSGVALFGVFWSNRTNRRAIEAADRRAVEDRQTERERDFRLWQRDTLLKLADEVVSAGLEAQSAYAKIVGIGSLQRPDDFSHFADAVDAEGRKIGANIARLRLIGAHETAQRAVALRNAINDKELIGAVVEVAASVKNRVTAQAEGRGEQFDAEMTQRRHRRDELIAAINLVRADFGQAVEHELARTNAPPTQPN